VTTTTLSLAELEQRVGQELAVSAWHVVTQREIDLFAEATGDKQWIHVDPERARQGPFETTIAHGFLTLSLVSKLAASSLTLSDRRLAVNYGLNRVRFPAPVPSGSRVRARFRLAACERIDHGLQITWLITMEREGGDKPCLVAEWIVRYHG
jgi:acyl dehydratase